MVLSVLPLAFLSSGCKKTLTVEDEQYIKSVERERAAKDTAFMIEPDSPFKRDSSVRFEPLHYYPVDPAFVFHGRIIRYDKQDSVTTLGTKGDKRTVMRYGYIPFRFHEKDYRANVYTGRNRSGINYAVIWFTDLTTGKETYRVGRYLDFTLSSDPNFSYTVDFNLAYNPYCAYSPQYSCSIPFKEDFIGLEIKAGEKMFHH
jgi:uncharacterized protein (DUF1684 family)